MKLEKIAKKGLKWGTMSAVGIYSALMIAQAGAESYYISRDKINSGQSFEVLRYSLSYNKNIPDIAKTLFLGVAVAHTINLATNFGEK